MDKKLKMILEKYEPYNLKILVIKEDSKSIQKLKIKDLNKLIKEHSKGAQILPILRPMGDLFNSINSGRSKLIPILKLESIFNDFSISDDDMVSFTFNGITEWSSFIQLTDKLLEWNFDVYNLIEEGKAVSMNSLIEK